LIVCASELLGEPAAYVRIERVANVAVFEVRVQVRVCLV
jgi:hypothetical protein